MSMKLAYQESSKEMVQGNGFKWRFGIPPSSETEASTTVVMQQGGMWLLYCMRVN
jgi:hypothetical protein